MPRSRERERERPATSSSSSRERSLSPPRLASWGWGRARPTTSSGKRMPTILAKRRSSRRLLRRSGRVAPSPQAPASATTTKSEAASRASAVDARMQKARAARHSRIRWAYHLDLVVQRKDLNCALDLLGAGARPPRMPRRAELEVDVTEALDAALVLASTEGHVPLIRAALQAGADPNAGALTGETALHAAAKGDNAKLTRLLLARYKADPNRGDWFGATPLIVAVTAGSAGPTRVLLKTRQGIAREVGGTEHDQGTVSGGCPACAGACALDSTDRRGDTALHAAARSGQSSTLALLLAPDARGAVTCGCCDRTLRGLKIDGLNAHGLTPLHLACWYDFGSCVRILLGDGAASLELPAAFRAPPPQITAGTSKNKPEANENDGEESDSDGISTLANTDRATALHVAARKGHSTCVFALLKTAMERRELGAGKGGAAEIEAERAITAVLDARTTYGETPVLSAVRGEHVHALTQLLEAGADCDLAHRALPARDTTPILVAVRMGRLDIAEILLKHGADPTKKDGEGNSALSMAAHMGKRRFVVQMETAAKDLGVQLHREGGHGTKKKAKAEARPDYVSPPWVTYKLMLQEMHDVAAQCRGITAGLPGTAPQVPKACAMLDKLARMRRDAEIQGDFAWKKQVETRERNKRIASADAAAANTAAPPARRRRPPKTAPPPSAFRRNKKKPPPTTTAWRNN